MPLILGGGDIMAAAETGSGKTGAFALPVLQVQGCCTSGALRSAVRLWLGRAGSLLMLLMLLIRTCG